MLEQGSQLERVGDWSGAEGKYRIIVEQDRQCAEGWFRLGVVCLKQQKLTDAIEGFQRALGLNHKTGDAWNMLGVALACQRRPQDAEQAFRRALQAFPKSSDILVNLGRSLHEQGKHSDALEVLSAAQSFDPSNLAAYENLASVYFSLDRLNDAERSLRSGLQLQPNNASCVLFLSTIIGKLGRWQEAERGFRYAAQLLPNASEPVLGLGVLLSAQGRYDEACEAFHVAVSKSPQSAEAHANLGNALRELGRLDEAEASLKTALKFEPMNSLVNQNMGKLSVDKGRLDQAIHYYGRALQSTPRNADALVGLGAAQVKLGNYDGAMASYSQSIQFEPKNAIARFNRSMIYLARGEWELGWREYEWRWQTKDFIPRAIDQSLWHGEPFPQKTLFLRTEQGFGDTIQFCRYAELVKQRGGYVILGCSPSMMPLLKTCTGIDRLTDARFEPSVADYQIPLMSLPRIFGTTPESIPNRVPYLAAEPERIQAWSKKLPARPAFRVGIAWQGNPNHVDDRYRSVPLAHFEALAHVDRVHLISLQKGIPQGDSSVVGKKFHVTDFGSGLDAEGGAFQDTAAIMRQLDLVITIDSAVAHLAGALGVRVWVVLAHVADWRWLRDRDDTAWYPSMKLYRQSQAGAWREVFERMANDLAGLVQNDLVCGLEERLSNSSPNLAQVTYLQSEQSVSWLDMGIHTVKQGRFEEACDAFQQAANLEPSSVDVLANLGNVLAELDQVDEAELELKRALSIDPTNPAAHQNIGKLYFAKGHLDSARYHYRQVLFREPQNADAYVGMGAVDALQGKLDEAMVNYDECLKRDPGHAQAHFNRAIVHLARGEWESGWKGYEWRWKTKDFAQLKNNKFSQDLWAGTPFPQQTLLIYCEQGLGDIIQFCRYARLAKERGGTVFMDCPDPLIPLLKSCAGVDRWIPASDSLPPFDHHIPLMSLPRIFGTLPSTVPGNIPYLSADPVRVQTWKRKLESHQAAFKIGIVWKGSRQNRSNWKRSVALEYFEPIAALENVQLISLQKGNVAEEIADVSNRFSVIEMGSQLDNEGGAFMDTAAIMTQLDLVISVDSAPAHLAGSLGVPVWVALTHGVEWRWLLDRDDTPWYPSMRLFRQSSSDDWKSVFHRMAKTLRSQLNT